MRKDLIDFDVIQNGIKGIRARAENGIKRITADFLVSNFFEDIEVLRKRGFSFEEIIDELHILLAETIPEKDERDKLFAIKSGTLKVYMSRQRKVVTEATARASNKKQSQNKTAKNTKSKPNEFVKKTRSETAPAPRANNSQIVPTVPTGRARATDLDREI